jgi:dual specificity tyrosine-phosphorylation-regulated kinase 2/3/4
MGESREKLDVVFEKRKLDKKTNSNPYDLSREEIETFGNRFPESFQKVKLLGRGGFSLVWLG